MPATDTEEHRLRSLLDAGRSLVSELELEPLLDRLLSVARELTAARYAALGILDRDSGDRLERFIVSGIDAAGQREIGDFPRGRGILGELIRDPKPLRLADLSAHPRSYGFPPGHPPMTTFLGVPIRIRGVGFGNLYLTEKTGGEPFSEADEETLGVIAEWAAIAIDNARLYASVEQRANELERAVSGLEATTTIARAIGGETDLARVLELIVKRARALVEARSVFILLEQEGVLALAATGGEGQATDPELRIPVEGTVPGAVLRAGRPERLSDVHSRMRHELSVLAPEARTALLVPLTFRGRSSGLLVAVDRLTDGPEFDAEDERLLTAFAASAGTAVATAQTVEAERLRDSIAAAERERVRWARELHDETLQGLGALKVLLKSGGRRAGGLDAVVSVVSRQIDEEIIKLQGLITDLRPAALDELGLGSAIIALMKRAQQAHDVSAEVELELDLDHQSGRRAERLEPEIESTVYRVVQEAITNAAKHADASEVRVRVTETGGEVLAEISDDGSGFDPAAHSGGFGLVGMEERLGLVGGSLVVRSAAGEGTTITARVPARYVGDADRERATG